MLTDDMPDAPADARSSARFRLRARIEAERRRRRRGRSRGRIVVCAMVILTVLGLSPMGRNGELQPLIGLADAIAASPPPLEPVVRHWYTRTVRSELVEVDPMGTGDVLRFLVPAVEETWHDGGTVPFRTTRYLDPVFLSPEDERRFRAAGLDDEYTAGLVATEHIDFSQLAFVDRVARSAPDELEGMLRRSVAGLDDRRLEEVHLLRLTADLMQLHADDPIVRSQILRVIADIPGIAVTPTASKVRVSFDYVDGDRPLRLEYEFDAQTAHLVGGSLALLADRSDEPASVLWWARHEMTLRTTPAGS